MLPRCSQSRSRGPCVSDCTSDSYVPIELTALINDTTGTLIASNYVDPNTKIAVIFGTGCNAAYMEKSGNIPKMNHLGLPAEQDMAINVGTRVTWSFSLIH
jgi:hexokinase